MHDPSLELHTPQEVERILAERVRAERLRFRWKQSTLAGRAGVSLPTLRRYEKTGRTSLSSFLKLCHALGHLDSLAGLLEPPAASSIAELEARETSHAVKRKRGVR